MLGLGEKTFTTATPTGQTLKSIFEDASIPKRIWDVRNDADALWALHGVGLAGVTDVQLMENASRRGSRDYIRGLAKCIQFDAGLTMAESRNWTQLKDAVTKNMPADIFAVRPMATQTAQYCANDVLFLPRLHDAYQARLTPDWRRKVLDESKKRVQLAHSPGYEPQSESKKLGPWGKGMGVSGGARMLTYDEMMDQLDDLMVEQNGADMERDLWYENWLGGGTSSSDA